MKRQDILQQLQQKSAHVWDIAIIGGGSSGFGVALDALSRGLSVVLLEKSDFAKGTSSRSTKLLHGGVRYLAQGDVFLVLEALKERGRLLENAPHLTTNQPFIIPIYTWFDRLQYSIGLKLYDLMAGRWRLGKSVFINKNETLARMPQLKAEGLMGGVVYHDGQFDDARMIVALARTCQKTGGLVLNYAKVTSIHKNESGQVNGLEFIDEETQHTHSIQARMVVNATGVFADKILKMDNPDASKSIQPSQGIHLVLDKHFLGGNDALMIPKTSDGRVLFAVPWHGKLVVGTTDTLLDKPKLEPQALESEIDFVLETACAYLTKKPTRADVLSVFAGLRPLAAPKKDGAKSKEISRSHKVILASSNLVTLTGGKWTTFRKMGEDTVAYFEKISGTKIKKSTSANIKIHGYSQEVDTTHLAIYGSDAVFIRDLMKQNPALSKKLHPQYPYTEAEIVFIVNHEMPVKIEDVLSRRLRVLLLDAKSAIEMSPKVAEIMAREQGRNSDWIAEQLENFEKTARKYLINP